MDTNETMKRCAGCKQLLSLGEHFKSYKKKSPYSDKVYTCWNSRCQPCRGKQVKRWRQNNPEKIKDYYLTVDKPKCVERARAYRERYPDRPVQNVMRYRRTEQGKLKHREDSLRRYYMERSAPGVFTKEQIDARIEYFGGKCWICRGPYNTMDHVIPIARGGTNWPSNRRPICTSCNSRKGARPIVHASQVLEL